MLYGEVATGFIDQLLAKISQDLKKYKFVALLLINTKSATLYSLPAITYSVHPFQKFLHCISLLSKCLSNWQKKSLIFI